MPATSVGVMGSTGSIGTQTLEVAAARPGDFEVVALGAARSVDLLAEQATAFRPAVVAIADASLGATLAERIPSGIEVLAGPDSLAEAAQSAEVVINGVVGFAGLPVTLATLEAGRRLGLANKESLIAAGPVVQRARATPGAELLPVDSEHCAIHQCLRANDVDERVSRIVLTASGGPFRGRGLDDLADVTLEEALSHPTWAMGPKVTVDSSTLMNKGLEVIEAHELFGAGGGDALAADIGAPLLGSIPLDGAVTDGGDTGRPVALGDGPAAEAYQAMVEVMVTEAVPPIDMAGCTARLLAAAEDALDAADAL